MRGREEQKRRFFFSIESSRSIAFPFFLPTLDLDLNINNKEEMPPSSSSSTAALPVVLITGCSAGGIGYELARALAASGSVRVIATARDVSKMEGLLHLLPTTTTSTKKPDNDDATTTTTSSSSDKGRGGILALLPLDVTDEASVSEAALQVLKLTNGNGCDILVNNAGMTFKGTVLDSEVSETARLFDTNVFGLLRVTKALSSQMIARGRGLVVNVGSATGYIHQATKSSYSASKHSVRCLTDCLRIELAPFNVRVFLVSPGYVATPIDDKAGEQGRWFAPRVGVSPYAPAKGVEKEEEEGKESSSSSAAAAAGASKAKTGAQAEEEEEGFKEICTALASSIFKYGPGATAGAITPSDFSGKLSAVVLREWGRTSPARGRVTRPPTAREYLRSMIWLPTVLGGPVRHWREVKKGERERERKRFDFERERGRGQRSNSKLFQKTLSQTLNNNRPPSPRSPGSSVASCRYGCRT